MSPGRSSFITFIAVLLALGLGAGAASAKDTIKVGFIGPLSGGTAANGIGGRNSADLAVRLRNKDPDAKHNYELVVLDDQCKPSVGVQQATKLAADNDVVAAVTHYCSAVAIATVDVYHRFGLPAVVWGAVLPDITYGNDYEEVFRVNGTMINQNEVNAKFMLEHGYKEVAVIHDTTDYGRGHNKYFTEYFTKGGGDVVARYGVTFEQQDFATELTEIKSINPDAVYFGGLTPQGVRIRIQMDKLGVGVQFDGTSGIVSDAYIKGVGANLAEGTLAFREGAPTERLPGGQYFLEQYRAQGYAEPPEAYGAFAFAAMNLVLDTIERVGPDRDDVVAALGEVKDHDSIVGPISFDHHGQNTVAAITKYVIQDGQWTVWEESLYAAGKRRLVPPESGN